MNKPENYARLLVLAVCTAALVVFHHILYGSILK